MRKMLSLVLAMLLVVTMLPMNVLAAEEAPDERAELIALACEVFPEYAPMIRGEISTFAAPSTPDGPADVIHQETRSISEDEALHLAALSDGNFLLSYYTAYVSRINANTSPFANGAYVTHSYKVYHTDPGFDGVLYLNNVQFTIYTDNYDQITSRGIPSTSGNCSYSFGDPKYAETASSAAKFTCTVTYPGQNQYVLEVGVRNNNIIYSVT